MLELFTQAVFSEHLNTIFRVNIADPSAAAAPVVIEIELTEVSPGRQTPRQEQFSLLFRGPADAFFEQGNYQIEHEKLGAFELLLVPVARDDAGFYYEAVFNRLIK